MVGLMVGLMLLKNIYDMNDEESVARWMEIRTGSTLHDCHE